MTKLFVTRLTQDKAMPDLDHYLAKITIRHVENSETHTLLQLLAQHSDKQQAGNVRKNITDYANLVAAQIALEPALQLPEKFMEEHCKAMERPLRAIEGLFSQASIYTEALGKGPQFGTWPTVCGTDYSPPMRRIARREPCENWPPFSKALGEAIKAYAIAKVDAVRGLGQAI